MHLFLRDDELKLAPIQGKKVYSAQHLNWDISASLNRDRVKPLFKCSPEQGSLAPALSLHKALFLMEAASIQTGIQTLGGVCFISTIFCCSLRASWLLHIWGSEGKAPRNLPGEPFKPQVLDWRAVVRRRDSMWDRRRHPLNFRSNEHLFQLSTCSNYYQMAILRKIVEQ